MLKKIFIVISKIKVSVMMILISLLSEGFSMGKLTEKTVSDQRLVLTHLILLREAYSSQITQNDKTALAYDYDALS